MRFDGRGRTGNALRSFIEYSTGEFMNRLCHAAPGSQLLPAKRLFGLLVACLMSFGLTGQLYAEFLTPEDVGVAGEIGATWPKIVYVQHPSGNVYPEVISDYQDESFGVVSKYKGEVSGGTDIGGARAGISITPLMGRIYAKAFSSADPVASQAIAAGIARETVELTVPDGWNSAPMLRVDYHLTARLEVTGSGTQAEFSGSVGSDFKVETPLGFLPSDFTASQNSVGVQVIDTTISGWIQSIATEDPHIWQASWLWEMSATASSAYGKAIVDATHTFQLASLTFANGQSFEELGVTVRYLSGNQSADDLTLPADGTGPQPVPEPAPLTMLGSGVMALWALMIFRRRASAR